jgi:hypothetical protein
VQEEYINGAVAALSNKSNIIPFGSVRKWVVYALWYEDEIVYIGQSRNLLDRLAAHSHQGKTFDGFTSFTVGLGHKRLEKEIINRLKPIYNQVEYRYARRAK